MRIFEFQFNPRARKDRFFKTFSFEKIFVGKDFTTNVYGIGELSNVVPQNSNFLDKIAHLVSEEYRTQGKGVANSDAPFKKAIGKVNDFLLKENQQGNVDWLGNLHLLIVAFSFFPRQALVRFSLAKSGSMQVFLARKGQIAKIANNKTLESTVSGKLLAKDKMVVATQELCSFFESRDLLRDLAFLNEEKQYQALFKQKEKQLMKTLGLLFVAAIDELAKVKEKRNPPALTRRGRPSLAWRASFLSFFSPAAKRKLILVILLYAVLMAGSLLFT